MARTGKPPSSLAGLENENLYQDSPGLLFGHQLSGPWAEFFDRLPERTRFVGGGSLPTSQPLQNAASMASMQALDESQSRQAGRRPKPGRAAQEADQYYAKKYPGAV
jgi:hypothetical protein